MVPPQILGVVDTIHITKLAYLGASIIFIATIIEASASISCGFLDGKN
jgi:hypothetical protein